MFGGKEIVLKEAVHRLGRGSAIGVMENERQNLKGLDEGRIDLVCFEQLSHHPVHHRTRTPSLQERPHGLQHGRDALVREELQGAAERGEEGGAQSDGDSLRGLQEGNVPHENAGHF